MEGAAETRYEYEVDEDTVGESLTASHKVSKSSDNCYSLQSLPHIEQGMSTFWHSTLLCQGGLRT